MWALNRRAPIFAVLTILALLAPALPDALTLWHDGTAHFHHDHGSAHAGGWTLRSGDHAHHEALQIEPAEFVHHAPCGLCAGRTNSVVPLLPRVPTVARHEVRGKTSSASRRAGAAPVRLPGGPRAPPTV